MSKLPGYGQARFRDHGPNYEDSSDMEPASWPLFAKQGEVPRLPVPPLDHTMEVFLRSARPHASDSEWEELQRKVRDFVKGSGPELQKRLEQRKAELPNTSWFIKDWNDLAYLSYRDSVVWNVSYYLQFQDELADAMRSPARRAARFLAHALTFRHQVVNGTLAPDMSKDKPMSNTQYKYMFNACRMPGEGMDFVRTYAPDLHRHIAVVRKNRFFTFDVLDEAGNPLSVDAIHAQLDRVVREADRLGSDPHPVGVLTSDDRDVWLAGRRLLTESLTPDQCRQNKLALERIESSILAVCLDDSAPTTREEIGRALLNGDGRNRFWDKSIQLVFFDNGRGGYIGEHAMMDGTTTTRMVNFCLDKLFEDDAVMAGATYPAPTASLLPPPERLDFALDRGCCDAIAASARTFDMIMSTKELSVLMFHGYGKNQIKKFKMSPDAFAQVAIQYAYYLTFGTWRGTYESTQTRSFLHGRTEVTRSCSVESVAFSLAMTRNSAAARDCHSKLLAATQAHSSFSSKASKAMGCDRHMLGLKLMLKPGEKVPEIFSDVVTARSGTWALSTSGLVGEHMDGWGFGEVVPHGLGIGYAVLNDRLRFTVTSRHAGWAPRMTANLENALLQMRDLCMAAAAEPQSKL